MPYVLRSVSMCLADLESPARNPRKRATRPLAALFGVSNTDSPNDPPPAIDAPHLGNENKRNYPSASFHHSGDYHSETAFPTPKTHTLRTHQCPPCFTSFRNTVSTSYRSDSYTENSDPCRTSSPAESLPQLPTVFRPFQPTAPATKNS